MFFWRMLVVSLLLVGASAQAEPLRLDAQGLDRVTGAAFIPLPELVNDSPFLYPLPVLGSFPWIGNPGDQPGMLYPQICPPRCGQPVFSFPGIWPAPWLPF